MSHLRIVGTGSDLPARVMTNAELEELVDTSDAWIRERTGIKRRHLVAVEGGLPLGAPNVNMILSLLWVILCLEERKIGN